jgi:A/G-specific adenine glycosylase
VLLSKAVFSRRLLAWYDRCHRRLPWRADPACGNGDGNGNGHAPGLAATNPYHVLVSESMLQQTQVATVIPYFHRFIERFPTLADLAAADEQEVLRLWQGLGYYSRARNLQAAARMVVNEYAGELPRERDELLKLPGVGRYTAGAVSSIAFDRREPILDGNVIRVVCRLDKIQTDSRERTTQELLWRRAEEILPGKRVGTFNSALMELGAMVCTPRSPQCLICPVRDHCEAFAARVQETIPAPRKAKETPLLRRVTFCIRRGDQWLIEQRSARGRWAGMWQFVTLAPEPADAPDVLDPMAKSLRARLPLRVVRPRHIGVVTHGLTHRRYHFDVVACDASDAEPTPDPATPRAWTTRDGLSRYPLPRPHLKVTEMLEGLSEQRVTP